MEIRRTELSNYFGFHVLLGREGDVGIDSELVWGYFGEPDDWDSVAAHTAVVSGGKKDRL